MANGSPPKPGLCRRQATRSVAGCVSRVSIAPSNGETATGAPLSKSLPLRHMWLCAWPRRRHVFERRKGLRRLSPESGARRSTPQQVGSPSIRRWRGSHVRSACCCRSHLHRLGGLAARLDASSLGSSSRFRCIIHHTMRWWHGGGPKSRASDVAGPFLLVWGLHLGRCSPSAPWHSGSSKRSPNALIRGYAAARVGVATRSAASISSMPKSF
jgi:hypothetical protein